MYCPEFDREELCPSGYYCKTGYNQPIPCATTFICPEGSKRHFFFGGVIVLVFGFLFLALAQWFALYRNRQLRKIEYIRLPTKDGKHQLEASEGGNVRVSLRFENLGLTVRNGLFSKKDKRLLAEVTGEFSHGTLCAVMGPSGCGKTLFLNCLTGKICHSEGKVFVNGKEESMGKWRTLMGFVPQEDVMIRTLTVFENLLHSAYTRLPSNMALAQKRAYVEWAIANLGLAHCRDTLIGDEYIRGVSGGERKRVNIGLELVADPRVLVLDEPTSGLDATTSQDLIVVLKKLANSGILVITTLTQPRFEIFELVDTLLLLGATPEGGRPVYFGSAQGSINYFASLGFAMPELSNPADYVMDCISNKVFSTSGTAATDLCTLWRKAASEPSPVERRTESSNGRPKQGTPAWPGQPPMEKPGRSFSQASDFVRLRSMKPNIFQQTLMVILRLRNQRMHSFVEPVVQLLMQALAGLIVGIAVEGQNIFIPPLPIPYARYCNFLIYRFCKEPEDMVLKNALIILLCMAVALVASTIGVLTFSDERQVYYREASSGGNTFAYFLGKNIGDLPMIAAGALTFISVFFMVAAPLGDFIRYFVILLTYEFAMYGMGYLCIAILPNRAGASMIAAVASVVAALGASPSQKNQLAWTRWVSEAIYVSEVRTDLMDSDTLKSFTVYLESIKNSKDDGADWNLNNFPTCCIALVIFGLVFRAAAYFFMRFIIGRSKQK